MALGFEQQSYFNRTGFGRMAFGALVTEKKVYISGTAAGAGSGSMETLSGHEVDFDITLNRGCAGVGFGELHCPAERSRADKRIIPAGSQSWDQGETWMIYKD